MARGPDHTPRGLRDEANVGPAPTAARELRRLSELKYKVADGEPDIRGWKVFASTGRELGVVDDLLVDEEAGEVVMLDVDLKRDDRHTLAPLRAAWIDHATRRVVLDARELGADAGLPELPRAGAISDAEVQRFDEGYARTWGERGTERDQSWRVRRGDEELRFGLAPRADRPPALRGDAAVERPGEPWDGPATVGRTPALDRDVGRDREPRRLMDAADATSLPDPRSPTAAGPYLDESRRIDRMLDGTSTPQHAAAHPPTGTGSPVPGDRRLDRVDDAGALGADGAITPRELDARVRLAEGATIDEHTPVSGVRYEGDAHAPHDYGRPDERYGPEYGTGRIGFDRVVTRHRYEDAAGAHDAVGAPDADLVERRSDAPGVPRDVRYRRYDDAPRDDRTR